MKLWVPPSKAKFCQWARNCWVLSFPCVKHTTSRYLDDMININNVPHVITKKMPTKHLMFLFTHKKVICGTIVIVYLNHFGFCQNKHALVTSLLGSALSQFAQNLSIIRKRCSGIQKEYRSRSPSSIQIIIVSHDKIYKVLSQ